MIRNNCVLLLLLLVLSCDAFRKFISLRGTHRSKLQADTFLCSHEKLGENSFENDPTDKILAGFEERLIEDVYTDKDIEKLAEDGSDSSLEDVVKQLIGGLAPKPDEVTPAEKFKQIYNDIKAAKSSEKTGFDSAAILNQLFQGEQTKDPFDEKKVMIKLRNLLEKEDLEDIFLDPIIGDWI